MTDHDNELLQDMLVEIEDMKKNIILLLDVAFHAPTVAPERDLLTIEECSQLSGLKKSYIYRLTHERRIPHCKPGGNRVFIRRDDLLNWMKRNPIITSEDIDRVAAQHMAGKKR